MKQKQWIFIGLACLLCLGAGTGIGLLLGQNNQGTDEPVLLGQGNPLPAGTDEPVLLGQDGPLPTGTEEPVLLGGIGIATGTGTPAMPSQADSLLDKLKSLADDFNTLTAQTQTSVATREEWLALRRSMQTVYPGKTDKGVAVPSGISAACQKLGVKIAYVSGNKLNYTGWNKVMADITAGFDAAQAQLELKVEGLKIKYDQYERTAQELNNAQQNADPGVKIIYADMRPLMKTVISWAEEQIETD